jgi:hypothetical protein
MLQEGDAAGTPATMKTVLKLAQELRSYRLAGETKASLAGVQSGAHPWLNFSIVYLVVMIMVQ